MNPGPLKLDYDAGHRVPTVGEVCYLLRRARVRVKGWQQRRSRSGTGWHVVLSVTPRPRTCTEVVALQAILGSDPRREACNLNRARMVDRGRVTLFWRKRWNVLYV